MFRRRINAEPSLQCSSQVSVNLRTSAGSLIADEVGAGGQLPSTVKTAKWAFTVQPLLGWGEKGKKQKATAGWLASLPVFEPHWQVSYPHSWFQIMGITSICNYRGI